MPAPVIARDAAIEQLIGVFQSRGYQAASLSELSEATGLGRSSLYHHFPDGKADMARAVLTSVSAWMEAEVFTALDGPGEPPARLKLATAALDRFYRGGSARCVLGNFVLDGSRTLFAAELGAMFQRLMAALAHLARDAGLSRKLAAERAEQAVVQLQGALVLAGGIDDTGVFARTLARLPTLLLHNA